MIKSYEPPLLVLTAAIGAIDAVSYLGLDRVFTGNMTGNVLFIAFGIAGAPDLPVLNNLVALLVFMLGAVLGSRFTRKDTGTAKLPRSAVNVQLAGTAVTLALGVIWLVLGADPGSVVMIAITGVLALVCGLQAAAMRHIGIRDLSTVVVTMTMVSLSADSRLAGGKGADWGRRIGAIVAMGLGALIAAALTLHVSGAVALLAAGALMAVGTGLVRAARRREVRLAEAELAAV